MSRARARSSRGSSFFNKSYNWSGNPLGEYLVSHNKEDQGLSKLRQMSLTHTDGKMTTATESGKLLTFLVRTLKAKKVIDVGVFTGCSAYAMALALPADGKVIACDVSEEYTSLGWPYWEEGGVAEKIDLRIQPATDTLQQLIDNGEEGTFDFIFIDADKPNYPKYYELGMKLLRVGGIIMVDNALWHGEAANESSTDESTLAIRKINQLMRDDDRVDFVLTTVGDGTGLAQKLS